MRKEKNTRGGKKFNENPDIYPLLLLHCSCSFLKVYLFYNFFSFRFSPLYRLNVDFRWVLFNVIMVVQTQHK